MGKMGFSHVLGRYLVRFMKDNNTGLCTKNRKSVYKHNTKMYEDF